MRVWSTVLLALSVLLGATAVEANHADTKRFFGYYEGVALSTGEDGASERRELTVDIRGYGRHGFTVAWSTLIRRPDGRTRRHEYSVNFESEAREGVFGSAMRRDLFGQQIPLDPLEGDPFVWATVSGDTLTVHSLEIDKNGGYELQSYIRRLIPGGLALDFQRVRNGKVLRTVSTELHRAPRRSAERAGD